MARLAGRAAAAVVILAAAAFTSCSENADLALDENIEGFYLGETFEDFNERVGYEVPWTEIKGDPRDRRGRMIAVSGTPMHSREIEMSRLTFYEDRLMEIVFYYKETSFTKLERLREDIFSRYAVEPTSPDGSREMAYKTYWFNLPEMAITIRRITKAPKTELYVQYQHRRLLDSYKEVKTGR